LPDFCLSGNGCNSTNLLVSKGIDYRRLSSVRIPDKANRNLLAIRVKSRKLTQKLDKGSFAERVVDRRMESESGIIFGQMAYPSGLTLS
jgi:hypothetical protein